jgi:hypothetical protein
MPPRTRRFIDWKHSDGRALLLRDIENGAIPDTMLPATVFDLYAHLQEFSKLATNDKIIFKSRLVGLQKSVETALKNAEDGKRCAAEDAAALAHDRQIYPERTHNDRGERLWHNSPAKELLRKDLKAGKYEKGKPQKLRATREEYQEFKPAVFTKRIHQEIKTNKWYKSQYDGAYGKF